MKRGKGEPDTVVGDALGHGVVAGWPVSRSGGLKRCAQWWGPKGIAGAGRVAALLAVLLVVAACTGSTPRGNATAGTASRAGTPPVEAGVCWQLTHPGPEHAIEGYADHVSVPPGEPVRLFVSTTAPRFIATAFRIGNYPSTGGARVSASAAQPGHVQPAAQVQEPRHTVVAPWQPSLTVDTTGWDPTAVLTDRPPRWGPRPGSGARDGGTPVGGSHG